MQCDPQQQQNSGANFLNRKINVLMISTVLIILICDKLNDLRVSESAISTEALIYIIMTFIFLQQFI